MKIKDFMKSAPKDEVIFIGSLGSFIFIGTPATFEKQKAALDELNISKVTEYRRRQQYTMDSILSGEPIKANKESIQHNIDRYDHYLETYIPIEEREIVESYERLSGDGIVAIVTGEEQGNAWFKYEYDCSFLYATNEDFRRYMTQYCKGKFIRPLEAYRHAIVQEVAKKYM